MYDITYFPTVNKQIVSGNSVSYTGILVASKLNQKNGQDYPLIDIVDVDFNGAWISTMGKTYLYTAKDLIDVLNKLNTSNELSALTDQIEKIWKQINEITSTYITYSSLDEILQSNWQRKLEAGSYIEIDTETNPLLYTISVVGLPTYDYLKNTYNTIVEFNEYKQYIADNFYNKEGTYNVAYHAAYDAIQRVIDGADNAFDTLKEIADWILDQNRYTPVPWNEVINNWKEEYYYKDILDKNGQPSGKYEIVGTVPGIDNEIETIVKVDNPSLIIEDEYWKENYYGYIDENGDYVLLQEKNEINFLPDGTEIFFCEKQYYIEENYLTDIQNLILRVNRLDDTVGFKEWNERKESYTYSGHCLDIYNLQVKDSEHDTRIDTLSHDVSELKIQCEETYNMAYNAYTMGYTAYNIAYTSLIQSSYSIEKAELAYEMAYDAIVKVGEETKLAEYIKIEEDDTQSEEDKINELKSEGFSIYYYNSTTGEYEGMIEYVQGLEYYYLSPEIPGTGLTGRVEVVEQISYEANERSKVALQSSYESLYHLMVNNDNSTYVNLSLTPTNYFTRERTLNIQTTDASVNPKSGEIISDGIVNVGTALDIYTYASSWMMLYVDNDVNFEDLEEQQTLE